jgi:hypothetical protein
MKDLLATGGGKPKQLGFAHLNDALGGRQPQAAADDVVW